MKGLPVLDHMAATAMLKDRVPKHLRIHNGAPKTLLGGVLSGGFRPLRRLTRAQRWHGPLCAFCSRQVPEAKVHVFWTCPAWLTERTPYVNMLNAYRTRVYSGLSLSRAH